MNPASVKRRSICSIVCLVTSQIGVSPSRYEMNSFELFAIGNPQQAFLKYPQSLQAAATRAEARAVMPRWVSLFKTSIKEDSKMLPYPYSIGQIVLHAADSAVWTDQQHRLPAALVIWRDRPSLVLPQDARYQTDEWGDFNALFIDHPQVERLAESLSDFIRAELDVLLVRKWLARCIGNNRNGSLRSRQKR